MYLNSSLLAVKFSDYKDHKGLVWTYKFYLFLYVFYLLISLWNVLEVLDLAFSLKTVVLYRVK